MKEESLVKNVDNTLVLKENKELVKKEKIILNSKMNLVKIKFLYAIK